MSVYFSFNKILFSRKNGINTINTKNIIVPQINRDPIQHGKNIHWRAAEFPDGPYEIR